MTMCTKQCTALSAVHWYYVALKLCDMCWSQNHEENMCQQECSVFLQIGGLVNKFWPFVQWNNEMLFFPSCPLSHRIALQYN